MSARTLIHGESNVITAVALFVSCSWILAPSAAPSLSTTNYLGNQATVVLHSSGSVVHPSPSLWSHQQRFGWTSNKQGVGGVATFSGQVLRSFAAVFVFSFSYKSPFHQHSPFRVGFLLCTKLPSKRLNHMLIFVSNIEPNKLHCL